MHERGELGARGEAIIAERLVDEGFVLLARNARVGRLELDVIARRGALVVFCEVRSRSSTDFIDPVRTIDHRKVQRVRSAAAAWLAGRGMRPAEIRFDAAAVVFGSSGPVITYYEAAF